MNELGLPCAQGRIETQRGPEWSAFEWASAVRKTIEVLIAEISCRAIWKLISSFVDGDLDPQLRAQMEEHLRKCTHCAALMDGTKNVVRLMADERTFELPAGFGERLREHLNNIRDKK